MNKSWSELNRKMQIQLKKEATFADGIETLFELRKELMQAAVRFSSGENTRNAQTARLSQSETNL